MFIAGSPMISAASACANIDLRSDGEVIHSGSKPRNSGKIIFTSATDVRDESSRATLLTFFKLLSLVASTTLRAADREPTQTSGTTATFARRWYSIIGTSAALTSLLASISAHRA